MPTSLNGYRVFSSDADFYEMVDGKPTLVCQYRCDVPEIIWGGEEAMGFTLACSEVRLLQTFKPPSLTLFIPQVATLSKSKRAVPSGIKHAGSYIFGLYQHCGTGKVQTQEWTKKYDKYYNGTAPLFQVSQSSFRTS